MTSASGVVFSTATTEGSATTAWILGLRVLSAPTVTATTEGKSFRISAIAS